MSYSHEWHNIFGPHPWGLGEGTKGQISLSFNYKVNFKDFITMATFVCLLTICQMKDIKHIRHDFHSMARVGLGGRGVMAWSCGITN